MIVERVIRQVDCRNYQRFVKKHVISQFTENSAWTFENDEERDFQIVVRLHKTGEKPRYVLITFEDTGNKAIYVSLNVSTPRYPEGYKKVLTRNGRST